MQRTCDEVAVLKGERISAKINQIKSEKSNKIIIKMRKNAHRVGACVSPSSKQSCWNVILWHLKQKGHFLLSQNDDYLIEPFLFNSPSSSIIELSQTLLVHELIYAEYGKDVLDELYRPLLTCKQAAAASIRSKIYPARSFLNN